MATELGIKQPTLWAALNGKKGIGGRILSALHVYDAAAHAEIFNAEANIVTGGLTASATGRVARPVVSAHEELEPLRRHASARLQLPPYDYPEAKAKEMVQAVLAFKHDTALESDEVAKLADHIERMVNGLPAREPQRSRR